MDNKSKDIICCKCKKIIASNLPGSKTFVFEEGGNYIFPNIENNGYFCLKCYESKKTKKKELKWIIFSHIQKKT